MTSSGKEPHRDLRPEAGWRVLLSGFDILVFTARIGEHPARMRRRLCERAAWAGISLALAANEKNRSKNQPPDLLLPSASFIVNGTTPAQDPALVSASAELRLANGAALLAKFDGEFAAHSSTCPDTGTARLCVVMRW